MAEYKFIDKSTGKTATLADVDAFVCGASGEFINEHAFCPAYQGMIAWMFAAFVNVNDWDNKKALRWLARYEKKEPGSVALIDRKTGETESLIPIIKKTLDRYTMVAWRK